MKLIELKRKIDALSKKAKKAKVDPEIRVAVLPNFPSGISLRSKVVSSLDDDLNVEDTGNAHYIYLAEKNEEGAIFGEITERFGWGLKSTQRRGLNGKDN